MPGSGGPSGTGSGGSSGGTSGNSQGAVANAYVGTGNSSTNGIYGFAIAPDGTATSIPGSPSSGPGSYVVTNSAYVLGTDGQNIAGYKRTGNGSLQQSSFTLAVNFNQCPTCAGGTEPWTIQAMSLDHSGQTLYALENAGADDLYYFFFNVSNGTPTAIGKIGPSASYSSPLVFSPDNQYAYGFGCFHLGWDITGFRRNGDASLTPITTSNDAPMYAGGNQFYCPVGQAVSQMGYMAVADTAVNTNTVGLGVYKINADGSLTLLQNSTLTTALTMGGNGCCGEVAMSFDPSGQMLALAGQNGIQMYQLMPGGTLTSVGGLQQPGPNYLAVQWDSVNHVFAIGSSGLFVFDNSQGVLTLASGAPHAAGVAGSLAVLPTH